MKKELEDTATAAASKRINRRERFEYFRSLVKRTAQSYVEVRNASAISALNLDPLSRKVAWTPTGCHFLIDAKSAVMYAVRGSADGPELVRAFFRIADGNDNIGRAENKLIEKLGPILSARKLDPKKYFLPRRVTAHRGIDSIPDSAFMRQAESVAEEPA